MTLPTEDVAALVARLRDGLSGVTPGPWFRSSDDDGKSWSVVTVSMTTKNTICYIYGNRAQDKKPIDAAHIALCSPDNIRALLDHIAVQDAALSTLAGERDEAREQNAAIQALKSVGIDAAGATRDVCVKFLNRAKAAEARAASAEAERDGLKLALIAEKESATTAEAQVVAMSEALTLVRSIIVDGAMTGFNCHAGDWAERLFASQWDTSQALKSATALLAGTPPSGAETEVGS